jgi:hypothetical protein
MENDLGVATIRRLETMTLGKALLLWLVAGIQVAAQHTASTDFAPTAQPSFQVDYPTPTADKPQSKLWFMDGCWWALLPRSSGPSLWQRTYSGWREHPEIASALGGVPGRADVWPDHSGVTAVGLADLKKTNRSITVFRLGRKRDISGPRWDPRVLAEVYPPSPDDAIETATLVQDSKQNWWVAAVAGVTVCVWTSAPDATEWFGPIVLAEGIDQDDICVVTRLSQNRIGVLWSDQVRDAVSMRIHTDGTPAETWHEEEVIEMGNKTADDHLNTALTPDGTLWVASKNEVDEAGKPQFVLRVRSADGIWSNWPYGIRQSMTRPSRPIVVAAEDGSAIFTGYGDRSATSPHGSIIVFARVNLALPQMVDAPRTVIAPDSAHNSFVQNVTGPRSLFPMDGPWIVLASDQEGRVYEADLRRAFSEASGEQ